MGGAFAFDQIDGTIVPVVGHLPVVVAILSREVTVRVNPFVHPLVEFRVAPEHAAKLDAFIRSSNFHACEKTEVVGHSVVPVVVWDPFCEEINPFLHPVIPIFIIIEFDGDVVRHVMGLVLPNLDKIWLNFNQSIESGCQGIPVLFLLMLHGLHPKHVDGHTPQSQRGELHRLTGRVDFHQLRLGQFVLIP